MKIKYIIIAMILCSLLVVGCVDTSNAKTKQQCVYDDRVIISDGDMFACDGYVYRIHDDELNVTCYVFTGYRKGGISCISDSQIYGDDE